MPRVPYPTDLRDAEWAILEPLLPPSKSLGRPRADLRAILNAIRYVTRTGAQWRMVPRDLVPWALRGPPSVAGATTAPGSSCTTTCERMSVGRWLIASRRDTRWDGTRPVPGPRERPRGEVRANLRLGALSQFCVDETPAEGAIERSARA